MYKNSTFQLGERKCPTCRQILAIEECFDRRDNGQGFKKQCRECSKIASIYKNRQSSLSKQTNIAVYKSHERLLNNALRQKTETTCPVKLRGMHPSFTDHQISRMSRLNEKINAANDFLIEEQNLWLNPQDRTPEGIEYRADLFDDNNDYEQDKEELSIVSEQKGI
jgi:CRISPR/Cas system-associated protein Cas10 (large subunit of type III CRISPR-Cas system)